MKESSSYPFKNPSYQRKKWKILKQLLNSEASYPAHTYATIIAPPSLYPRKKYCDITGLQAKYTDPRTRIQYRSFEEYQLIKSGEITPGVVMILRIRTPEGALRVELDPAADKTIQNVMNKIEGFGKDFSLSNNPQNKRPFPPSTMLASIPLKHGDMLFLAPGKSFAAKTAAAAQTAETEAKLQPAASSIKIDEVDKILEKQSGLISRPRDNNFCRHGQNAMCDYCMPLEPYDQRYLEEHKIKHLSFHAYIKKLSGSDKNQAGGSGAGSQHLAALEEPSYLVKRDCTAGHQPYPLSMCAKCQPSAIVLQQQTFRMVDHVEFEDPKIVDNFISFWRQTGLQRFGYLYGRYVPYPEVPLGIKAVVSAIYEPPQKPAIDGVELENDPHESSVAHVASALGLRQVGMIYTDLMDDGSGTGKVICRRHLDSFFLSSAEVSFIAQHQFRHPNPTRLTPTHRFGSKFVTVVVSGDSEQQIHLAAYQVSNTAMGMIRDHVIDASMSPTQMRVRRSTKDHYVPDVFFKYKNEYGALVQGKADPTFPVEYLLVTLTEGFPQQPEPLFRFVEFPIENRGGLGHQDMDAVKARLVKPNGSIYWENLSDFHMLLYLKFSGLFSEDDFNKFASTVVSAKSSPDKPADFSALNEIVSWQTVQMILKEMSSSSGASAKSTNASTAGADKPCWTCAHCTFSNAGGRQDCEMCGLPKS